MKETNQQPLQINFDTLLQFALNIEEAERNPGVTLDQEDDEKQSSSNDHARKKAKADHIPKNSILEGSPSPVCSFCGTYDHKEPKCHKKKKAAQEAKQQ
jgi:hypothetical protein